MQIEKKVIPKVEKLVEHGGMMVMLATTDIPDPVPRRPAGQVWMLTKARFGIHENI